MKIPSTLLLMLLSSALWARSTADYLPADANPDPSIPAPESILGWEVGDWHVGHDKLVQYMQALAASSPRVSIKVIGYTHERRPLLQLVITSPSNQGQLESLRQAHLDGDGPLVVWLGYSVHGNEPSGSNASMLAAYYLASSQSEFVDELLDGTVVLVDPSINPDGLNRFASWANSNAGIHPVSDPVHRQHVEHWPGARTNHYWFDLNRDWLPLVHPESRARIVEYHRWLPHVLTDHHEQGRLPGFFFQPGAPSRQNPLTPQANLELTRALAAYHAEALDQAGQPYFTEEAYDDFYFGKGSTYPDINGSIGILFEQKAIRGQALETSNGVETFPAAVANQFHVSLSTLRGAWALQDLFKTYQAGFHEAMLDRAESRSYEGWLMGDDGDPARAQALLDVLDLHLIEYSPLGETVRAGDHEFIPGSAWVIPAQQRQFGLLEALMEQRTTFEDNTFYDVSAWTLPLAYNLPFAAVGSLPDVAEPVQSSQGVSPRANAAAWIISWNQLDAPAVLQRLLDAGARVRAAKKAFSIQTDSGMTGYQPGALVVQRGIQNPALLDNVVEVLSEAALGGLQVTSVDSTMTSSGPDLGSINFVLVEPVNPLIVGGEGASAYDVGEIRFALDTRLGIAATLVEMQHFGTVDLNEYTHLLLADGKYSDIGPEQRERISQWVLDGGILVAAGRAAQWAEELCFESAEDDCAPAKSKTADTQTPASRQYADYDDDNARQVIGGAISAAVLDLSHPLGFGYQRPQLPVFRRGTVVLAASENAYSTPLRYTAEPLMAGFIGSERLNAMRGAPAAIAEKTGDGLVVRFANNPLFRGFWRGTERLFFNALYFGQIVKTTHLPEFAPVPVPEAPRHQ